MALGRVQVPNDGDTIFSANYNNEFNNILNNPIALISPTTGPINFNGQAHTGLSPSAVTGTSGSTGQALTILQSGTVGFLNVGQAIPRVQGLIGALSSQSGTFSADGYVMKSSSNLTWMVTATSAYSASVGTAGPAAGGRDKAGAISSTEVHWYAITTGPGSTAPAAIVSSQAPPVGPVLPAGFAGWTYLGGSPYTSASTTVSADHLFRGSRTYYHTRQLLVNGYGSTAETSTSYVTLVPANALAVNFSVITQALVASQSVGRVRIVSSQDFFVGITGPTANDSDGAMVEMPTITGRTVLYSVDTVNSRLFINVNGYIMPNGDV